MCQQPMHELSLNLSSFSLLWVFWKGDPILLQELGQHINLLFHTIAFKVIALIAVCALVHFTFVFLLLVFFLGPCWSSGDCFFSLLCSGGFLGFSFLFESTLESPAIKAWSLDGLMVPIITSLSCSCVRDSMKSARLGIFQVRAVSFVA